MKPAAMLRAALMLLQAAFAAGQSPVAIELDTQKPGPKIPDHFIGLSFETAAILPRPDGSYLFQGDNSRLIALFKTLGVRNLRIGGNTADRPTVKIPDGPDIDHLFEFAKAAGVGVIYTLRMKDSQTQDGAGVAKDLLARHASEVDCISIGNEPNMYFADYSAYRDRLKQYMDAIAALPHASGVKFCGPSTTPGKPEWSRSVAADFGASGRIRWVTQHSYPGGSARKVQDAAAGRETLLSGDFQKSYDHFYQQFAPEVERHGLGYRLEETNNFYNGGREDVSDTFASALWGLDYLYWWASHGAQGLNFHTGDIVAAGAEQTPCRYAVFWSSSAGYSVHPLGYALKAFDLGNRGRMLPAQLTRNPDGVNMAAYAVLAADGSLYVTLINKEHGSAGRTTAVTIAIGNPYVGAEEIRLTSPQNNVSAKSGITLGGSAITDDGRWAGSWNVLPFSRKSGKLSVTLPPATAAIIKLTVH